VNCEDRGQKTLRLAFTDLKGMPRDQQRQHLQDYLNANPQVEAEVRGIRQPTLDFRDRCDVEVPD
jgi:heme-binding protein